MDSPFAKSPDHREKLSKSLKRHWSQSPESREQLGKRKERETIERLATLDTEAVTHKKCTKCGELKPLADFSIRKDKLKCGLIYVRPESSCRKCTSERNKKAAARRKAEGRTSSERSRRWKAKMSEAKKEERRRKDRERQTNRRREEGIPPRNFKKRPPEKELRVPVEPASVLVEVLLETHSKKEIAMISGVNERLLLRMEKQEEPHIHIELVDKLLTAFERQDDLDELYPLKNPEPEPLIGYGVLDPKGILEG